MRRALVTGLAATAVVLLAGGVAVKTVSSSSATADGIGVTTNDCATGWTGGASGQRTFAVRNRTTDIENVDLVGADHLSIYGHAIRIAPGTTVRVVATLPPGEYSWRCTSANGVITFSKAASMRGAPADAHPYQQVVLDDLVNADLHYRDLVTSGLDRLRVDTDALVGAISTGTREAAQAAWLTAHLDFARLGAAYDTFGDHASAIEGSAAGLPRGADDPDFAGFGRLEHGLWNGETLVALAPIATALAAEVGALVAEFPHDQTPTGDPPLRAHEILENALQFELTGQTDLGSHTNLATARADVDATNMVLDAMRPLLVTVAPDRMRAIDAGLDRLSSVLDAQHRADGTWTPVEDLSLAERQRIDSALDGALELLAPVPDLLTPPQDTT